MELSETVAQIRDALPEALRHRWDIPPGLEGDALQAVPDVLRNLYALSERLSIGDFRCVPPNEIENAADVQDDFDEWGLRVDDRFQWIRFGKCAETRLYVHRTRGVIAAISAWDLKSGRLRLRVLADDVSGFLKEYLFGTKYMLIFADPEFETVPLASEDDWMQFLLAQELIDGTRLAQLENQWAGEYIDPSPRIPEAWSETEPGAAERSVAAKLARLDEVNVDVRKATRVHQNWDFDYLGVHVSKPGDIQLISEPTESLWRLHRLVSSSSLGTLQFLTEEIMLDEQEELPNRLSQNGIDASEADQWFVIGTYQQKARLLLNRVNGSVAGLEPAPAKRLRHLHDDLFEFIDEFALGRRHPELCYSPRSRAQATAAGQWVEFLELCGVIPVGEGAEGN